MFRFFIVSGVCIAAVAGIWAGGETYASKRLAQLVQDNPATQASSVEAMRQPPNFGVELQDFTLTDPAATLAFPWARIVMSPTTPTTAQLQLPDHGQLQIEGQDYDLGLSGDYSKIRLAPLKRLAPDHIDLMADAVTLDGQAVIEGLDIDLQMGRLSATAPLAARSVYEAAVNLGALRTQMLAQLGVDLGPLPDPVTMNGKLRLWMDGTPSVTDEHAPDIVGWQTEGLTLGAGAMSLRLVGRVVRGADGLTEGQLAIYTTDAKAIIDQAAELDLIPQQSRMLLTFGLGQLARAEIDPDIDGPEFPEASDGQMRLPVVLKEGQIFLGGIAIGAAPPFGSI
ncbi:DUF2125 domain-containing protein [Paracoccus sp. JM45]|uniref:DUF2125 domain-containing protein n=1 Tax=Paracoccus sp. JM45 TaxID=2283626 RepID=UPI000E6C121E|nr:DUF2125 domain-containing protein [Paracoccus sp. JM45]RJE79990.1 DUF2125 domain-containing protein [Paracoccus sp. JM45]